MLGDRGYSTVAGIEHVVQGGGYVTVRVNTSSLPLDPPNGGAFDLLGAVTAIQQTDAIQAWEVGVCGPSASVEGRLCVIRKSQEAIKIAQEILRKEASRKGRDLQPETFEYAKFVILFTTFPKEIFPADQVGASGVQNSMASRTGFQTIQLTGPAWAFTQIRRRKL